MWISKELPSDHPDVERFDDLRWVEIARIEAGSEQEATDRACDMFPGKVMWVLPEQHRQKYTLQESLDRTDPSLPWSEEDEEWLTRAPVGRELI